MSFFTKVHEELDSMTYLTTHQQGMGLIEISVKVNKKNLLDGRSVGLEISHAINSESEACLPTNRILRNLFI